MKNKLLSIVIAGACAVGNTSCDKNFEEINIDPTKLSPANMNYNYLFTAAQMLTSGNSDAHAYEDWRNNLIYCSCMIQHLASTVGYWNGDKYTLSVPYNTAYWDVNYSGGLKDIVEVVENLKDRTDQSNLYNIARIFKVYQFQRMTDMYGDIPYSEADLGYFKGITSPKYDKQQDIYADMLNELQDAAAALDVAAANTVGTADELYKGNVVEWKKFAYSEMLRLAMRMSKVDAASAEKWAKTAVAGGVFTSNDDNAILQHQETLGTPVVNGTGYVLNGLDPDATRISKTLMDVLQSTHDPRIPYLATVSTNPPDTKDKGDTTASIQLGMPNGYDVNGSTTDISKAPGYPGNRNKYSIVNRYIFSRLDAPTFFLTYAETALLEAEAAKRGWIDGSAQTFYNAGVTAAILQLNQTGAALTGTDASNYLAANPYNDATSLDQINTQYWIATFMDEYEAWANWRRSDYPKLTPVNYFGNVTNGTIPRRFIYPAAEVSINQANYNAALANMGPDVMTTHVWWDK